MIKTLFVYLSILSGTVILSIYSCIIKDGKISSMIAILWILILTVLWLLYRNKQFAKKVNKLQMELIKLSRDRQKQSIVIENGFADIYYYLIYQNEHLGLTTKLLEHRISSLYHAASSNNTEVCNLIVDITLTIFKKSPSFEILASSKKNLLKMVEQIPNTKKIHHFEELRKKLEAIKEIEFFMTK